MFCLALPLFALQSEDLQTCLKLVSEGLACKVSWCNVVQLLVIPGDEVSWWAALMCCIVREVNGCSRRVAFPASSLLLSVLIRLVDRVSACVQRKSSLRRSTPRHC